MKNPVLLSNERVAIPGVGGNIPPTPKPNLIYPLVVKDMKFANGMFGACICVVALLGTAIGGFVLNIEEDTRTVTNYNYVADVSGLFSYSDAPEYVSYNPSTNYVGYSLGGVTYTPATTINNYRYVIENGGTDTDSITVTDSSSFPADYGNFQFGYSDQDVVQQPDVRFLWDGSINFGTASTIFGNSSNAHVSSVGTPIEDSKVHITKLTNVLNELNNNMALYMSVTVDVAYDTTYPVLFYAGGWSTTEVSSYGGYFNAYHTTMNESNSMPDKLEVNIASYMVNAYRDNVLIWSATADNVGVLAWYSTQSNGLNSVSCSATLSATFIEYPTYGYMQPSAGVTAVYDRTTNDYATWSNGYDNSVIDIKIVKNGDLPTPQQLRFLLGGTRYVDITRDASDWTVIWHLGSPATIEGEDNIGNWLAIQMRIDAVSGRIIFTPTNDVDLTTTVEPNGYSFTAENVLTRGTIQDFQVKTDTNSLKFQVTDTSVFLNTYSTVMVNPTLEISDYFPSYGNYRLNFYSFALLGDSITINGQVCPINKDDGTITFENVAGFSFTKKLENLYITVNVNARTHLSFVNDNTTYDLGDTVDTTVSFDGMWFFTTGLYKMSVGSETYWNWNLDGFQLNGGECLIIFLGIIALGVLIYTVYNRGKLGFLDWLVIIFVVFIGSCMLGF